MYKHILVPIAYAEDAAADKSIAVARQLGDQGARITLLHVMEDMPNFAVDYLPEGYAHNLAEAILADLKGKAEALPNTFTKLVHGKPGPAIVEFAAHSDVDCIVLASHKPEMADYLLGSTAARVVRHAGCSVHVIR